MCLSSLERCAKPARSAGRERRLHPDQRQTKPRDLESGAVCTDWMCDCNAALVAKVLPQGEDVGLSCHWQTGTGKLGSGWEAGVRRAASDGG